MTPTRAERNHVRTTGKAFEVAHQATTWTVKSSGKLVGLDTVRDPIAWKAALKATGYKVPGMVFPRGVLIEQEMQDLADALFADAVEAARSAVKQWVDANPDAVAPSKKEPA